MTCCSIVLISSAALTALKSRPALDDVHRSGFVIAGRFSNPPALPEFHEPFHDRFKEPGRQQAVVVTARLPGNLPQVVTRPSEDVYVLQHDPGGIGVKTQVLGYPPRNLDGCFRIGVRAVCDRHDGYQWRPFVDVLNSHDDCARSRLATLRMASGCFIAPKIRIGNDQADLRLGVCHRRYPAYGSVVVQEFVEMIMRRVHPGGLDGIGNLGRQIIEAMDAPLEGSQAF